MIGNRTQGGFLPPGLIDTRETDAESAALLAPQNVRPATIEVHKGFLGTGVRKVVFSLACSIGATAIWNVAPIKQGVLYLCSCVIHIGGDPLGGKDGIFTKVEEKLDKPLNKPHRIPVVPVLGKSPEQIQAEAERKEAERKRREESEIREWQARADVIKFSYKPEWAVEKYRVEVPIAEGKVRDAERDAELEEKKKPYYKRADAIGLKVEPSWDLKTLEENVEEAEHDLKMDADYQEEMRAWERAMEEYEHGLARGPNARCPNQRCRHPMRIGDARMNSKGQCPKCGAIFPCRMARANWTPPPAPKKPEPPKQRRSLLKRVFG